jgi:Transposase, Mutator family
VLERACPKVKHQLRAAWAQDDHARALDGLQRLAAELDHHHPGAAASLREGLEETVTLTRLGITGKLRTTLQSTNAIESMISILRRTSRNVDHRERLVARRTALINDLRWQCHDLWPEYEIPTRALISACWQERVAGRLARAEQTARVRVARDELRRVRELTRSIDALQRELAALVGGLAPQLLAEQGCGVLTAAKLIGEVAGIGRFSTDAKSHEPAASRRSRHPRGAPTVTAWTAAATASSTARCTASPSRKPDWIPRQPPTSRASAPKARAAAKRCAASSATSLAESSGSCNRPRRPAPRRRQRRWRRPSARSRSTATRPQAASP